MTTSVNKEMNKLLKELEEENKRPSLLLHACCAPCASAVLERLEPHFDVTLFFYNPNIMPKAEYELRLENVKKLIEHFPRVKLLEGEWDNQNYLSDVIGLEGEAEGGTRCAVCFALRLRKTAELAKDYDYFATTLTVSPHKNSDVINNIGEHEAKKFGTNYLPSDFKKENGYLRSIELCKEFGIYRQSFCGCGF